jgi:hypothetical protein
MVTFLEKLTDDLLLRTIGDLSEVCLVFPTRRAGLHFKKTLSKRLDKPAWSPVVFSIEDFIASISNVQVPDRLTLIFEQYKVYTKYFPSESFEEFYPWGLMLLKDFDDADSSMADTRQLFAYISEAKMIDEQFDLDEEEKQRLNEFWKMFFGKEHGQIRKTFLENWIHLGTIYNEFKKNLLENRQAYSGLATRIVAERLAAGELIEEYKSIVFAGFYALSKAEEAVINHFVKNGTANLYWDVDSYYADDERQEGGAFIRKNKLIKENYSWKENLLSTDEKKIKMIGAPMQAIQSKIAGEILLSDIISKKVNIETTAVVLPDEQLLFPTLYALPQEIEDINVTMGYPLRSSPLYDLIESLFDLQNSIRTGKTLTYYYKNVSAVLTHPYVRFMDTASVSEWLQAYADNKWIRISSEALVNSNSSHVFNVLFKKINSLEELFDYFNEVFGLLLQSLKQNKDALHSIEKEYIYHFYTQFKRLEEIVRKQSIDISIPAFRNLLREVIKSARIPFAGEPLKGLQLMGFLETRVLDFENLIILSMNEDVMPATSHHPSFIPFSIRKVFGLPTYEEQNAIAAYHFYRLLQRAKNIYLIYNTEVKSIQAGEKSRFLLQIENELCKINEKINLKKEITALPLKEDSANELSVLKSDKVLVEMESFFRKTTQQLKYSRKFSASALTTYISCSLKFYFQYIAKLKEIEDTEETIEGSLLGTILHEAMHKLYAPYKTIQASDFDKIKKDITANVDAAIKEHFSNAELLEGKNLLMRNVLIELVEHIVANDKRSAPLTIKSLEHEIAVSIPVASGRPVTLYGIIDRVDSVNGITRIVDYKTGKTEDRKSEGVQSLFSSPDYKEDFQTFFYSYLLHSQKSEHAIKAGLFRLKKVSEGIKYINKGEVITSEQFDEFESHLKNLLAEIFNPDVAFTQTEDEKRCLYCSFKDFCNR